MKESFEKFKKKIVLEVLIKCIVSSLSIGLIAFSIPYIYIKIQNIEFNILYLILIALSLAVITFGIMFLIRKPNDKKVAKILDKEFNLNEKVQTMIEYENKDGLIINLQRNDTLSILSNTSIKKLTMKFSVFFFGLIIIAMSLCITAFAIPSEKSSNPIDEDTEIVDPNYELDNWTIKALEDLIEYVENSNINSSLKTKYVSYLRDLIVELEESTKESEMKEQVLGVINNIKKELDIVNTNNEIYTVLKEAQYSFILTFAAQINKIDLVQIDNALDGFIIAISGSASAIAEVDNNFGQLLKNSNLDKKDEACIALINFANAIVECQTSSDVTEAVNAAVETHTSTILAAFTKQRENSDVSYYVIDTLYDIFGLEKESTNINPDYNPGNNSGYTDEEGEEKNPQNDTTGGLGTGEVLFGSNDSFFDPESGRVVYGDVLAKYQNDILAKIDEGIISEELEKYFEFYYDILIGTLEDEE